MKNVFKKIFASVLTVLFAVVTFAQETPQASTPAPPSQDNILMYILISGMAILLLAVLFLGNMLVELTKLVIEKNKKAMTVILFLLTSSIVFSQEAPAASTTGNLGANWNLWMAAIVLGTELFVVIMMLIRIRKLLNELSDKKPEPAFEIHMPRLFDNINASVSVEKEKDILLDHNYDGIRELDNALPPWWKYSFYISIVWSIFYLGYYYFGGGPSSRDEYNTEVQLAKIEVEEYKKKNALNVDETNVQLADGAGITEGTEIFKTNCAACHGNVGEGNQVGPNLTDNYWLHGGSLNDIFKSVKYGWPAKGMRSWQADLSAVQIKNVTSYIKSLHGTNPANAKESQGDLYSEGGANIDSTVVAAADTIKK